MIGYYVHHVGRGHLHRARAVARVLAARGTSVTGLSSLPEPEGWPGPWLRLDRDDEGGVAAQPTARGRLHWAPLGHRGLRSRMATIAGWLRDAAPAALVVDVSVEVALLARLHGVPVVGVVLPGRRGDEAHLLGFDVTEALVGCWPPEAQWLLRGVPDDVVRRVVPVGALSRFGTEDDGDAGGVREADRPGAPGRRSVVVLMGAGGTVVDRDAVDRAREQTPHWAWTVLGGALGDWVDDPRPLLRAADVVVTHAGESAVAEVAALRRPAVVVPQPRPHDEQRVTAAVLAAGPWPVVVEPRWPDGGWGERLERAAALPGDAWRSWCDGEAAGRIADVVASVAVA